MQDVQRVSPHILRREAEYGREEVGIADMDGIPALVVPVTEELAESVLEEGFEGMYPAAVSVEEIEETCERHGLATVGFFGFEDGGGLDVVSVEGVSMVLEED